MKEMKKVEVRVTRVYPRGVKGHSKSLTVEGVNLTDAFHRVRELFEDPWAIFERSIRALSDGYIGSDRSEAWEHARRILNKYDFHLQKTWDHDD